MQDIIERLDAITQNDERADSRNRVLFLVGCVLCALALFGSMITSSHRSGSIHLFLSSLVISGLSVMSSPVLLEPWRRKWAYPADLARLGGVQAIPALFLAWKHAERYKVYKALVTLLPYMQNSDAHLLTPLARDTMHLWLQGVLDPAMPERVKDELVIATLKALRQVGDTRDIPTVEPLTKMEVHYSDQAKIKEAAMECLPTLQANGGNPVLNLMVSYIQGERELP